MRSTEYRVIQLIGHIVAGIMTAFALLPFVLLVLASLTDNTWATANGFTFFPKAFSLDAYKYILVQWTMLGRAYLMTILVTALGTATSILISTSFAYGMSHSEVAGMKFISFMAIFTMLFNGGLVATYYTYANLFGIKNTFLALIVPGLLMNAFSVILLRNYYVHSIPASLSEAARIDGASEFHIFARIILPLSKPIVATVGLLTGLAYWNDWQNGLYYLTDRGGGHLYTIQILLNKINENIQTLAQNASLAASMGVKISQFPSTTVRMAIAVIGILPIMVMYPFFQRYFVKGITLGGVKE